MELKLSCYLFSHQAVVFKTKVSHFKVKNTPLKDTKMEMESSKECPVFFLWTKGKLLDRKLFIEEFNFVLFMLNPLLNLKQNVNSKTHKVYEK